MRVIAIVKAINNATQNGVVSCAVLPLIRLERNLCYSVAFYCFLFVFVCWPNTSGKWFSLFLHTFPIIRKSKIHFSRSVSRSFRKIHRHQTTVFFLFFAVAVVVWVGNRIKNTYTHNIFIYQHCTQPSPKRDLIPFTIMDQ